MTRPALLALGWLLGMTLAASCSDVDVDARLFGLLAVVMVAVAFAVVLLVSAVKMARAARRQWESEERERQLGEAWGMWRIEWDRQRSDERWPS